MKIHLNEMVFYGYHGVHDEERKLGQRFIVSSTLYTDPELDAHIRSLEDTVDYTKVYADIKEIMESRQFQLLECCANSIADRLLSEYRLIESLSIRIQKPSVPIQGSLRSVEVEVFRKR
ncbi:MAG: dihydroneopterin aldolase [Candidatus Cloacimonetes bacterium]|nr:dihydroneopterin aldolase [Candidatus Cloacimonadota bacterium]MDD2506816.1 dihydroneopterin aldolase [Candidatus Cloacimonadota bacterium]MDD4146999.1 dihydroneopterin aldolase [Candidatus Cloacimonadota bacterium]MDD4560026.1 dihydroneopterin aldolase [Candidatus Cloacimonadota bacterium]